MHEVPGNTQIGKGGKLFLEFVVSGPDVLISFGLMTDVGEETVDMLRILEPENFDKAEAPMHLADFLSRLKVVLRARGALLCGYTKLMIEFLKQPRIVFIDKRARKLGGYTDTELQPHIDSAFMRLENWLVLAEAVTEAEFPSFEVMQAVLVAVLV